MQFINQSNFKHPVFGDVVRINYNQNTPKHLINDFGYSYIMLTYGEFEAWDKKGNQINIPKIFTKCSGDYFHVKVQKNSAWISIELPNHAFYNITKLNTTKCRNKLFDLYEYLPKDLLDSLYESLKDENNIDNITSIFSKHIGVYCKKWIEETKTTPIVNYIFEKRGLLNTDELTKVFPYGKRTIERLFNEEVGTSPYNFICLIRFNYIIRDLQNNKYDSINELTSIYNYYDTSHFEKDFKKFLGQSSKSYHNDYNPLLTNSLSRIYNK